MNFLCEVCYEEVFGRFLQREHYYAVREGHCPPNMEALVFDEDYADPVKNQKRFVLLKHQWELLCPMPKDTKWRPGLSDGTTLSAASIA